MSRPTSAGEAWERFARDAPLYFIDPRAPRSEAEFLAGGGPIVDAALAATRDLERRERMLEIGCGVGRTTIHFARHFGAVEGIDLSPTMVRLAQRRGLPDNVRVTVTSGRDLAPFDDASFDFVFSHLVFQHIADADVVASYLGETARVLRPGGIALLQFDTRPPPGALVALLQQLPDPLLPRARRRHMRRYRRRPGDVLALASVAGLRVAWERDAGSAEHWLALTR